MSLLNLVIRTDAVTKEIIPKQTDMNLTYIEFLDCDCSSRLRRLNLNFRRKIKIPTSQITNPRPFFKTLKVQEVKFVEELTRVRYVLTCHIVFLLSKIETLRADLPMEKWR